MEIYNLEEFLNPPINPSTIVPIVHIKSPLREETLEGKTYDDIRGIISEQIQLITQSNQFRSDKQITVKMGLESPDDPLKAKHHLLFTQKEQENNLIGNLIQDYDRASTADQLDNAVHKAFFSHKPKQISFGAYPYILIQAKRKRGFYAKMNQEFSEKGFASVGATIGYWNPFGLNDKIQVEYEGGVNQRVWRKFNYYNYALKWMLPYKQGTLEVEGAYSFTWIARGLYEGVYHFSPKLRNRNFSLGLDVAHRSVLIDTKSENNLGHFANNYMVPSNKLSIKLNKEMEDTMSTSSEGVPDGRTSDITIEATLPVVSQAQFVKLDYHDRRYYDGFIHSLGIQNPLLKKILKNSSFEIASSVNAIVNRTKFVSDYLKPLTTRGFDASDLPNQSPLNLKTCLKWNIHNFPVVGQAKIRAFLFYQAGLTFEKLNRRKFTPSLRTSAGWGFCFPLSNAAHLQVIYNLLQHQRNSSSKPVNFQVRIGFND